jgi:hypothetical protein
MFTKYTKKAPCFAYFYYNDYELLDMSEEELLKIASEYKENGVEYLIAFSVTHFRWSFYPYEKLILDRIGKFVEIFHSVGLKFVEHHSSNLIWNNESKNDREMLKSRFDARQSKLENWPLLPDYFNTNWAIDGVPVKSMLIYNGNTGEPTYVDMYGAVSFCINNPAYVKFYLAYLKKLYDLGIDGIMTDDIEYFDGNACACEYCRKDFFERTGFILPEPGDAWESWHGNYEDESFREWLHYRYDIVKRFHVRVKEHYESLGLEMYRPWYVASTVSWSSPWAYVFDDLPALDVAYQENCNSDVIRYTWPRFVLEGAHRFALGQARGIPSVSQFYPDRSDTVKFSWALALSCGQDFMGTCHDAQNYPQDTEYELRRFEEENQRYLSGVKKVSQIAFFDSLENRRYYKNYNVESSKIISSWAWVCMSRNIHWEMLLDSDMDKVFEHKIIVLPEVAILSEEQLCVFAKFVEQGGILVWCGDSGVLNHKGEALLPGSFIPGFDSGKGEINFGKGRIIFPASSLIEDCSFPRVSVNRWIKEKELFVKSELLNDEARKEKCEELADYILSIIKEKDIDTDFIPDGLRITMFENENKDLLVHFVNACKTLVPDNEALRHSDRIPFPELNGRMCLKIKKKDVGIKYESASLRSPGNKPLTLTLEQDDCFFYVNLDLSTIEFYGLLTIERS